MITCSFDDETLMNDAANGAVEIGKLKMYGSGPEILIAKIASEEALILKCLLGGECLGFLSSSNESEMRIEAVSHDEYVSNRAKFYQLLKCGFFCATSFDVALAVESTTQKDVYLMTDSFTGDVLIISTDSDVGEDSDHAQYRDAKAMDLAD